jgi:hypothetical protein
LVFTDTLLEMPYSRLRNLAPLGRPVPQAWNRGTAEYGQSLVEGDGSGSSSKMQVVLLARPNVSP